jgi:hypothetical protein
MEAGRRGAVAESSDPRVPQDHPKISRYEPAGSGRRPSWHSPIGSGRIVASVPAIPLEILDCSIYLYPSQDAAEAGEQTGGSGFLVFVGLSGYEAGTFYAVTNTHVVGMGCTTVRLNTTDGGHAIVTVDDHHWFRHPDGDDVSVAEVTLTSDFRFKAISTDSFLDGLDPTYFTVGQEVFMVGRYVNHEGRQRNNPTARFGHIAQLPYEPIRTSAGIEQEGFLVDMRSLAGYSGSPVFVYRARTDLTTDVERWVTGFEHASWVSTSVTCRHTGRYSTSTGCP